MRPRAPRRTFCPVISSEAAGENLRCLVVDAAKSVAAMKRTGADGTSPVQPAPRRTAQVVRHHQLERETCPARAGPLVAKRVWIC